MYTNHKYNNTRTVTMASLPPYSNPPASQSNKAQCICGGEGRVFQVKKEGHNKAKWFGTHSRDYGGCSNMQGFYATPGEASLALLQHMKPVAAPAPPAPPAPPAVDPHESRITALEMRIGVLEKALIRNNISIFPEEAIAPQ